MDMLTCSVTVLKEAGHLGIFKVSRNLAPPDTAPRTLTLLTLSWLLPGTGPQKASGNLRLNPNSDLQQRHRDPKYHFKELGRTMTQFWDLSPSLPPLRPPVQTPLPGLQDPRSHPHHPLFTLHTSDIPGKARSQLPYGVE